MGFTVKEWHGKWEKNDVETWGTSGGQIFLHTPLEFFSRFAAPKRLPGSWGAKRDRSLPSPEVAGSSWHLPASGCPTTAMIVSYV